MASLEHTQDFEKVSIWKPVPLREAKELASKWIGRLKDYCELVDVTGSVYNESKDPVGDIDLICLPKDLQRLRSLGPVKEDDIRIVFSDEGRKIEIWKAEDQRSYELKRWYRQMEKSKFIQLASKAKAKGWKLSWKEGLMGPDGKLITSNPKEIEQLLA
jgi:hypothetical protein